MPRGSHRAGTRVRSRLLALATLVVLALSLPSCTRTVETPRAVSLVPALAWRPPPQGTWTHWRDSALALVPDETVGLWWLHCSFGAADWEATQWPDVWSAPRPLPPIGQANLVGKRELLLLGEHAARPVDLDAALREPDKLVHGDYATAGERVYVCAPRAWLAERAELRTPLRLWSGEPGESRVGAGGLRGSGFALLSGQTIATELARRGASELVFATTTIALPDAARKPNALRVTLGAAVVYGAEPSPADSGLLQWHRVALPALGSGGARLAFELAGDPACVFVLVPELRAPRSQAQAQRPRGARPDILLVLADTFRADLLTPYGAQTEYAPGLERLARESVLFERAWSASTWTLPAHASLLSGLLPSQHGAIHSAAAMPKEPRMLAEQLRALGYRTGAFTEGAYVSPEFGFARGFDVFHAAARDVEQTVDAALEFLDTADERPTFVFVHTYRTHTPYHASAEARAALRDVFEIPASEDVVRAEYLARNEGIADPQQLAVEYGRALEPLYRAGAWDLDRACARLTTEWDRRGFGRGGVLVFTSDHGEALGEHARLGHGSTLYDEVLRVPLLVRAPGLAPRRDAAPASLVDLPRTLIALARGQPWPNWAGRDLFAPMQRPLPVHAFECSATPETRMAAIDGALKLIVHAAQADQPDARLLEAYDLAADPLELASLLPGAETSCRDAWRHARPPVELLVPAAPAAAAELDPALRRRLEDLGYLGR